MIDPKLQALIDAPLANPIGINLPEGRRPPPRGAEDAAKHDPRVSKADIRARKQREEQARLDQLYDYYAGTDVPPERVAEHMGVHKLVEDGTDDDGKVKYKRVLDVDTVRQQLDSRRTLREGK